MDGIRPKHRAPSGGFLVCAVCGHPNMGFPRFCGECGAELKAFKGLFSIPEGSKQAQVTVLFGSFSKVEEELEEAAFDALCSQSVGRLRLVVRGNGALFHDLKKGRFSVTVGSKDPTEEDPLTAITIGLRLLRMANAASNDITLHLVGVTGRLPSNTFDKDILFEPAEDEKDQKGHELLFQAYRITDFCPPSTLFVDRMTYRMIRDAHRCRKVTELQKVFPNPIYEVNYSITSVSVGIEPTLVGRLPELARMSNVFERVCQGEGPTFFTLTGSLGIGKTRVLKEFLKRLKGRATIFQNPRERRRVDRVRRTPYSFFGEILRNFFGIQENEDPAMSREKLIKSLMRSLPKSHHGLPREQSHFIGLLCQVDFPESPFLIDSDEPAQLEQRAFTAFARFLIEASQLRPIVFAMDDLYSADHSSIRLIHFLIQQLDPAPVLFICCSRLELLIEIEKEFSLELPGERLLLQPLSNDYAGTMIADMLPDNLALSDSMFQRILEIADGNPFFLYESVRDLSDRGLHSGENAQSLDDVEIPGSLEGILRSRLFRLTGKQQQVLQKASIFGRSFCLGAVEMLYRSELAKEPGWALKNGVFTENSDDLESSLEELVRLGVLLHHGDPILKGETQYLFVPSLLQDLIYQEIAESARKTYHRLAAIWFETRAGEKPTDEVRAEIAHHYDAAEAFKNASIYHLTLAQRAMQVFAIPRAIKHLQRSLDHIDGSAIYRKIEGLRLLGEAFIINGQYKEALEQFEELLPYTWQIGHRVLAGTIYSRMGWIYFLMREFELALESFQNGHALHQESQYREGIGRALNLMGKLYTLRGNYSKARLYLLEALELHRDSNDASELAWTLNAMGHLLSEQGELEEAKMYYTEALELRKALDNPMHLLRSRNNLALMDLTLGDYDSALDTLLESADLAERIGEKFSQAVVLANLGELYLLRNEPEQAQRVLKKASVMGDKLGDQLIQAECARLNSYLLLKQEEPTLALAHAYHAHSLITKRGILSVLSSIYRLFGRVYASLGPEEAGVGRELVEDFPSYLFGNALACFEESIALAHQDGNLQEEAKSRFALGEYEVTHENEARGRYQLERALDTFESLGMAKKKQQVEELLQALEFETAPVEKRQLPAPVKLPVPKQKQPVEQMLELNLEDLNEQELENLQDELPNVIALHSGKENSKPKRRAPSKPLFLPELESFREKRKHSKGLLSNIPKAEEPEVSKNLDEPAVLPVKPKLSIAISSTKPRRPPAALPVRPKRPSTASPKKLKLPPTPPPEAFLADSNSSLPQASSKLKELEQDKAFNDMILSTSASKENREGNKIPLEEENLISSNDLFEPLDLSEAIDGKDDGLSFRLSDDELQWNNVPAIDPSLFPKRKKPSVYDSQVIITQVSDGDQISQGWFEEGRSDRSDEFWADREEDLTEVHSEILHEKETEKINDLEDESKKS